MDLIINFKDYKKIKIDTQIHTQKLNFFIILNYLFGNLQEFCKILKLKTQILKKLKAQTFEYFMVHMSDFSHVSGPKFIVQTLFVSNACLKTK